MGMTENDPQGPKRRRRRRSRRRGSGNQSGAAQQKPAQSPSEQKETKGRRRRPQRNQQRNPQRNQHKAQQNRMVTRDETSAGGLVVSGLAEAVNDAGEVDLGRIYVALIGRLDRRGRLLWSMPKGHVEPDEELGAIEEILGALLDISRLDAGAMPPSISNFNIGDLLRSLESIVAGRPVEVVTVSDKIKAEALIALQNMLRLSMPPKSAS